MLIGVDREEKARKSFNVPNRFITLSTKIGNKDVNQVTT